MKKHMLFFSTILAGSLGMAQQLSNPGFEAWSVTDTLWDGQPIYGADSWSGGAQTTDSYTGEFAAQVQPIASCGIMQGFMIYGQNPNAYAIWAPDALFTGFGQPVGFKPTSVSGYFKLLTPNPDDQARGFVILKKFDAVAQQSVEVGRGEITFAPASDYTAFTVEVEDLAPDVMPDTLVLAFTSGMGYDWDWENDTLKLGTLFVDQLRFESAPATAGIAEQQNISCTFFPNPSSGQLQYTLSSPVDENFELVITDASGNIVHAERTAAGTHTVDVGGLAAGSYHASIRGKRTSTTQTLIITD